jgi:hypothetical protein
MVNTGARLMPKFTFIGEHTDLYGKPDGTKVTYEFHVDSINDVLEHTDLFIRGCGYVPSGTLDYIPDEDYMVTTTELGDDILGAFGDGHDGMGSTLDDYPEIKSSHYFDTERNK